VCVYVWVGGWMDVLWIDGWVFCVDRYVFGSGLSSPSPAPIASVQMPVLSSHLPPSVCVSMAHCLLRSHNLSPHCVCISMANCLLRSHNLSPHCVCMSLPSAIAHYCDTLAAYSSTLSRLQ